MRGYKKIQMNQKRFILGESDSFVARVAEIRMGEQQVHLPTRPGFGAQARKHSLLMTSTPLNAEDERVLAALALALVDKPRATLQELAQAIGISKATLYRFSRTREELVDRLMAHGAYLMNRSLEEAELDKAPTVDALRRFIEGQLRHSELAAFMIYYWKPDTLQDARAAATWTDYFSVLDEFFVRGQREGLFRIEIGAAVLSESLISLLSGLMDAERRGRIARASLPGMIETLFLAGAQRPAAR